LPNLRPGARSLLALLLGVAVAAPEAGGAVRTRALPDPPAGVERSLAVRAAARPERRIHAIVEAAAGRTSPDVRLLRAVDGDLWLASLPAGAVAAGELPAGVRRAWDLRASDRIAPALAAALADDGLLDVRIKVFRDESIAGLAADVGSAGGRILLRAPVLGVLDARLPAAGVIALAELDEVRWIERAPRPGVAANNNMRWSSNVNPVQTLGIDGGGVRIGMWDGGLADTTHPDLAGRITGAEGGLFTLPHSTNVAGIAIGDGTNSVNHGGSPLQWRGVAPGAEIVGWGLEDAIVEIDDAIASWSIDLATNSWVMPVDATNCDDYGDYAFDAPEFDEIVTGIYGRALPVVFSAGNERDDPDCGIPQGTGFGTLPPPATAKNVISVAAHQSDGGGMTPFSSWGPTDDGRMKPDLAAPGCQLSDDFGITSTGLGGGYVTLCGTSMAAPVVSGSCAALIQEWRARFPADPRPATLKALLGGFASDRGTTGPDYKFGLGAIDLLASVVALQTSTTIEGAVGQGGVDEWTLQVPVGLGALTLTLAWDDPAGAELADTTLVNDLDLWLSSPSSATFLPFVLDPLNPGDPATTGANRLDNVEQVRVLAPEPGTWTASVGGTSVPQGPQAYSLVGFDARPPADPAAATATAISDVAVELTWIRAGDADRAGTLVVRSTTDPIAWSPESGTSYGVGEEPAPGVFVVAADDVDHSVVPVVDQPLAPGLVHHYAFFTRDEIPNWSPGVADTARTSGPAVSSPLDPGVAVASFRRAGPNPLQGGTAFRFELPREAVVAVDVFDAAGRRVAGLVRGPRQVGSHVVEWSGRDAAGRRVAAGVYFVRFTGDGLVATEKVLVVR